MLLLLHLLLTRELLLSLQTRHCWRVSLSCCTLLRLLLRLLLLRQHASNGAAQYFGPWCLEPWPYLPLLWYPECEGGV